MKSKYALIFLLLLNAIASGYEGLVIARALPQSHWAGLVSTVLSLVAIVCWYHWNSIEKGFRRCAPWTVGVVLLPFLVIPMYIFRSNPPGARWKALGKFAGFLCLVLAVSILSAIIVG
ncbi:hypothetical protein [Massilia sp. METH4]|uniref:hypothetical protein n=1 Tax=Massilia sp. METH4 TaxID=3123041 RepID=UPI0030CC6BFD